MSKMHKIVYTPVSLPCLVPKLLEKIFNYTLVWSDPYIFLDVKMEMIGQLLSMRN